MAYWGVRAVAIQIERITVKEAVARYLRCDEMKAKAKGTQNNTKYTLLFLVTFLGSYIQVHKVERSDMNRLFDDRSEVWGNGSYNTNLGHMRGFFSWCRAEGYAYPDWDPLRARKQRAYVEEERVWLNPDQYEAGRLVAPDARDLAVWDFAWYSGCRAKELAPLRVGDIDLKNGRYRKTILKKRGGVVIRWKPLGEAEERVIQWLDWYEENQAKKGPGFRRLNPEFYLFPSRTTAVWQQKDPTMYEANLDSGTVRCYLRPTMPIAAPHGVTRRINLRLDLNPDLKLGVHVSRRSGTLEDVKDMERRNIPRPMARASNKLDHADEKQTAHYTGRAHEDELADEYYHRDGKYFQERKAAKAATEAGATPVADDNVVQLFGRKAVS